MSTAPSLILPSARTNSLALSFQDVITVVLRMRYGTQRVADAAGFRASIRKMIATAVQEVRSLGYSDATSHMSLYAIIGFLDESVLNSQDPTFADWARRPLQEEMFGGHFAGEIFFKHVGELLNAHESSEVADALELHAICLLLGYRGKYAFGDAGEIHNILSRIRDKILRIRGPLALARLNEVPEIRIESKRDKWLTSLWLTTAALAILILVLFAIYTITLGSGVSAIQTAALLLPAAFFRTHKKSALLSKAVAPQPRVLHLRDSFIVAKVGLREANRSPSPAQQSVILSGAQRSRRTCGCACGCLFSPPDQTTRRLERKCTASAVPKTAAPSGASALPKASLFSPLEPTTHPRSAR